MKFLNLLGATSALIGGTAIAVAAQNFPLQSRTYFAGGGGYVQIAVQGDRACYHGFSARGAVVASMTSDPQHSGFYKVNGLADLTLAQRDNSTLLMGPISQLDEYKAEESFPNTIDETLQQCLDSAQPFYQRTEAGRGRG